jgi:Ca2+-binding EF-hand superfamily protein
MNKITDEKMKELKDTFDFYDKDGDGCLDIVDLQDLFKSKGIVISDDGV